MRSKAIRRVALASALGMLSLGAKPLPPMLPLPERVSFPSADGTTMLTGYLFKPETTAGRAGAGGGDDARPRRHLLLARERRSTRGDDFAAAPGVGTSLGAPGLLRAAGRRLWSARLPEGVSALQLRSAAEGTGRSQRASARRLRRARPGFANSPASRPSRSSCRAGRTAPAPRSRRWRRRRRPGLGRLTPTNGFRAALAFYPACGLKGQFPDGLVPYAPVRVFHGTADEEVSPRRCEDLVELSRTRNADIEIVLYPDAVHGFDDPGRKRQSDAANATAKADATAKALAFVAGALKR